eukprot:NODE_5426_length_578_cov_56.149338_g4708_i0.p3 GENE.NODE_5426_length_578_cov_56.149338_g4708_i0~~NODE_5426_length_578_cov_56.149338_g4708_i0.p3  ORF type:complete len:172 (+),score=46.33 NODE_5426_length_578_cov_56.149338_g4708_i0:22-516(+)
MGDNSDHFPSEVRDSITRTGDAKYHLYRATGACNDRHVVHVVGPDLREREFTDEEAMHALGHAHASVLQEVACAAAMSNGPKNCRLLPVSGGVFAGDMAPDMHHATFQALRLGFDFLTEKEQRTLMRMHSVGLCVFAADDLPKYVRGHVIATAFRPSSFLIPVQ